MKKFIRILAICFMATMVGCDTTGGNNGNGGNDWGGGQPPIFSSEIPIEINKRYESEKDVSDSYIRYYERLGADHITIIALLRRVSERENIAPSGKWITFRNNMNTYAIGTATKGIHPNYPVFPNTNDIRMVRGFLNNASAVHERNKTSYSKVMVRIMSSRFVVRLSELEYDPNNTNIVTEGVSP